MKNEMLLDGIRTAASKGSVRNRRGGRSRTVIAGSRDPHQIVGVLIGRLVALGGSGEPLVDFPGNASAKPLAAISIVAVHEELLGHEIVLMFEEGAPDRPVVMGVVEERRARRPEPVELVLDKRRFSFTAEQEIVLRCGRASITLTRAGKVLIRGAYLLNRSSGVNRIKGGSVQIN